jgi:hypothetical protein
MIDVNANLSVVGKATERRIPRHLSVVQLPPSVCNYAIYCEKRRPVLYYMQFMKLPRKKLKALVAADFLNAVESSLDHFV